MPSRQPPPPPPPHAMAERALPRSRGSSIGSRRGGGKTAGGASANVSVRLTPLPSLTRWLFSLSAIPWLLLTFVFLWEGLQFLRFSGEVKGFLEAAEAALTALGKVGGEAPNLVLKEELAQGLVRIYARNRFVWPFSKL